MTTYQPQGDTTMNYDEIVNQGKQRQSAFLAAAEQRRLVQSLAPAQPHPLCTWVGQQLIHWGQHLQGAAQPKRAHNIPAVLTR